MNDISTNKTAIQRYDFPRGRLATEGKTVKENELTLGCDPHTHIRLLCALNFTTKREREKKYSLDHKHIRKTNLSCS